MLGDSMYYGRGAGKLPTASAVVSDIVDCARHVGKTIMCFWDEEKVELENTDEIMQTFFVRVDNSKMSKEVVENVFGKVSFVENLEYNDEIAFVTESMKEKDFKAVAEKCEGLISRIRVM
jgi:homoserine dehydrogenase